MSEHPNERAARVRQWSNDREQCRRCGLLRINVIHEPDPDNAPEGKDYYDAFRDRLHVFVPSGQFEVPVREEAASGR